MKNRNITKSSKNALREYKSSEEEKNHNLLVKAFNRLVNNEPNIVKKGTKLTVVSVAKEAGLSRGTVYLHQEVFNKIAVYKANPRGSDYQRQKQLRATEIEKDERRKVLIEQLQIDKSKLAQENFTLSLMLKDANEKISELLKQRTSAKVVSIKS